MTTDEPPHPLILLGSARKNGNTAKVATELQRRTRATLIDLLDYTIYPYRYGGGYPKDDRFIELVEEYLLKHPSIILASPVYWYTMSGPMKQFVDRFTDLLTTHQALGRRLRGRALGVLSCANDAVVNDSFYEAFRLTANYLGMSYGPEYHGWLEPPSSAGPYKVWLVGRESPETKVKL